MNIIGNIYIDGFANIETLDGKSHRINKLSFGGFCNIFSEDFLEQNEDLLGKLKVHCFTNESILKMWKSTLKKGLKIEINHFESLNNPPVAVIVESNGSRTSFVLFDQPFKVNNFNFDKNDNLIFYGDKIIIKNASRTSSGKFYIDTAGNNYSDLLFPDNHYPKGSILSISSEYLTNELENRYLKDLGFSIISHNPKLTNLYIGDNIITIENEYFRNNKSSKITGLGDKFFLLISIYNSCYNLSLEESIKIAQKKISDIL